MLVRLWASVENLQLSGYYGVQNIRSQNIGEADTHLFVVRYNSVTSKTTETYDDSGMAEIEQTTKGLGRSFTIGFDGGFDSFTDIDPIKADYMVFFESGNRYTGRLFKINRLIRDDNYKEYVQMRCTQVEEQGTGARNK